MLQAIRENWEEPAPGGLFDFIWALIWWLRNRPMYVPCDNCGRKMWMDGYERHPRGYCSEECADYADRQFFDGELPF